MSAPPLQIWLRTLFVMVIVLLIWRGAYRFLYPSYFAPVPGKVLWKAYLLGLRFDLATALGTIAAPTALLWVPWPRSWQRWIYRITFYLTSVCVVVAIGFLWADLLFFGESGHHLSSEPADTVHDSWPMISTAITEYPLQILGLCILCALVIWAIKRAYRQDDFGASALSWRGYPFRLLLVGAFSLIGIRGGLQKEPLKVTDAITNQYYISANLSLNGWYSFMATMIADYRSRPIALADKKAIALTQKVVATPRDQFISPAYPLLRRTIPAHSIADADTHLNVVLKQARSGFLPVALVSGDIPQ